MYSWVEPEVEEPNQATFVCLFYCLLFVCLFYWETTTGLKAYLQGAMCFNLSAKATWRFEFSRNNVTTWDLGSDKALVSAAGSSLTVCCQQLEKLRTNNCLRSPLAYGLVVQ